ncbi:MAG: DNA repair protein RecO, partial [Spirochaetaceae bacterium]|nr:DNA repair protein RecO [Spirochaetaceae bacterium]
SIKITDFEVIKYHPEIRENLFKTWCASFCAELLIKTDATGEYEKIWTLANGFLDGISVSSEDECRIAFLRFVWRYIGIMGLQCDIESCIHCGETLNPKIHEQKFYYSIVENGFICNNCFSHQNNNDGFELSSEAIIFLQAVTLLSPKEARSIPLHYSTTQQLHEFLTFLINRYTGCKLKTLEMSSGIL